MHLHRGNGAAEVAVHEFFHVQPRRCHQRQQEVVIADAARLDVVHESRAVQERAAVRHAERRFLQEVQARAALIVDAAAGAQRPWGC